MVSDFGTMLKKSLHIWTYKYSPRNFPGGAVVKNPPANAGTRVWALVQEDSTCRGAAKPMHHNNWACTLELVLCNKRSHRNEKPAHRNIE